MALVFFAGFGHWASTLSFEDHFGFRIQGFSGGCGGSNGPGPTHSLEVRPSSSLTADDPGEMHARTRKSWVAPTAQHREVQTANLQHAS